jgi:tight adherence protein B
MHLTSAGTVVVKAIGLLMLWAGVVGYVYVSSVDPRGVLRRYASDYVAKLDADFRSLFLPKRGSELAWLQVVLLVAGVACHALTDNVNYLAFIALVATMPRFIIDWMVKRRRARIDEQAHGFALALANTLRTTANAGDALRFTAEVSAKPIREEIDLALREIHVGSTAEEALLSAAGRAGSPSLDIVVSTVIIGQKTGGDLPRILEGTAASLRELKRLEEYTDKVTRGPKQALFLSVTLMVATLAMLPRILPHYFDPLLTTSKGQIIVLYCALIFGGALFFAWRITRKSI